MISDRPRYRIGKCYNKITLCYRSRVRVIYYFIWALQKNYLYKNSIVYGSPLALLTLPPPPPRPRVSSLWYLKLTYFLYKCQRRDVCVLSDYQLLNDNLQTCSKSIISQGARAGSQCLPDPQNLPGNLAHRPPGGSAPLGHMMAHFLSS